MADDAPLSKSEHDRLVHIRRVTADVYSFVRSQELNRTLSSFTFDHYLAEAKRRIKGTGAELRDAAGVADGVRPTKLDALKALEKEFRSSLEVMRSMASQAKEE